jgi:type I restriction enzyme S subunit
MPTSLGELAEYVTSGSRDWSKYYASSGAVFIRTQDINRNRLSLDDVAFVALPERVEGKRSLVKKGDLLITITGANVGKVAVVDFDPPEAYVSQSVCLVRLKNPELSRFVQLQLIARKGDKSALEAMAYGLGRPVLNLENIRAAPVLVGPPALHAQIVAEIDKQFSRLDEAVANLQRVKANLKRYKAAVLKAAVEGRLVETAGGWRASTLGAEGAIIGGLTKNQKRNDLPLKLPYLRVANVYANELRLDDIEYIGVAEKELEKLLVRKGDLLVVEGNGSPDQIGRVALWNDAIPNCVHQNHLIKVRFGEEVLPEWALIWMLSPIGRHEIEKVSASTSGLHTLSVGKVSRLPIGVPSLDEQSRLVVEVDRQLSIIREVETEVNANLQRAQALRLSVLQIAFSESDRFDASNSVVAKAARGQEAASVVIAARVIAQNCEAATFGRVKLQKLLFLSTHHARIEASNDEYARLRAGPADLEMLQGVLKRLDQLRWFRERSREQGNRPEGAGYTYERLSLADDYKNHLTAITGDQLNAVDYVCQSLRTWSTDDCELLATVYAAWNDLLLWRHPVSDDAIVEQVHEHWHESKRRFSLTRIVDMKSKLTDLGLEPTGFGRPTIGSVADSHSRDLF